MIIYKNLKITALKYNYKSYIDEGGYKMDWEDIGKMMNKLEGGY